MTLQNQHQNFWYLHQKMAYIPDENQVEVVPWVARWYPDMVVEDRSFAANEAEIERGRSI